MFVTKTHRNALRCTFACVHVWVPATVKPELLHCKKNIFKICYHNIFSFVKSTL